MMKVIEEIHGTLCLGIVRGLTRDNTGYMECRRQQVSVPLGLFNSPLFARVFPNAFNVALVGGRASVFSHARGEACA